MERPLSTQAWPLLGPMLFAGTFLMLAVGMPLGLARVNTAGLLAAGMSLREAPSEAGSPLALLLVRLMGYLPLGSWGLRGNLASALFASLAVALAGRVCINWLLFLRPSREARQGSRDFLYEPIATFGAAFAVIFSLSGFEAATSVGEASATILVVVAGWLCQGALIGGEDRPQAGVGLAIFSGLSSSVCPMAGPILWPTSVWLALWSLRRGDRWPLLFASVFFICYLGGGLAIVALSGNAASLTQLFGALSPHPGDGLRHLPEALLQLVDELGVVGSALACLGFIVMVLRHWLFGLWFVVTLFSILLFHRTQGSSSAQALPLPLALALFITIPMLATGILHVAGKLGRAKTAAAVALSIIALVSPALDTVFAVRKTRDMLPMPLLQQGLAKIPLRSQAKPGSPEMARLFLLGKALGLRPDLQVNEMREAPRR